MLLSCIYIYRYIAEAIFYLLKGDYRVLDSSIPFQDPEGRLEPKP